MGLGLRAPSQTLDSVTHHVIAPLHRAGALVEVYLHSYNDTCRLHNPRAGEHNLTWRFDWELVRAALRPKAFVLSDQKADLRWLQDQTSGAYLLNKPPSCLCDG